MISLADALRLGKPSMYVVRHGEWDKDSTDPESPLTAVGIEQARLAGESIGRVPNAAIVASGAFRALQTAEIIRQTIEATSEVGVSALLEEAGNSPDCISDIDRLIRASLKEAGVHWNDDRTLVIVSHEWLGNSVKYPGSQGGNVCVGYSEVIELRPGSWTPSLSSFTNPKTESINQRINDILGDR